jgi:hypothetical protein
MTTTERCEVTMTNTMELNYIVTTQDGTYIMMAPLDVLCSILRIDRKHAGNRIMLEANRKEGCLIYANGKPWPLPGIYSSEPVLIIRLGSLSVVMVQDAMSNWTDPSNCRVLVLCLKGEDRN